MELWNFDRQMSWYKFVVMEKYLSSTRTQQLFNLIVDVDGRRDVIRKPYRTDLNQELRSDTSVYKNPPAEEHFHPQCC